MIARRRQYRPFASSGRGAVIAILITFALVTAVTLTLSINATNQAQNKATVVEVVARQRTLAERYVAEVLLVRAGGQADPALTASIMSQSVHALLDGGTAPGVPGDDDATKVQALSDASVRAQLAEEQRLVGDLAAFGSALLAHRPLDHPGQTGGEQITTSDPLQHLRVLSALTSNVALNTSRTIANQADHAISNLRLIQIALQIGGLVISLLLAWLLYATTRRQSAHFRSLVTSSNDLVCVLGASGCRYVSRSLRQMVGAAEVDLHGSRLREFVHEDDQLAFDQLQHTAQPATVMLRVRNAAGDWRHLEANVSDLRSDRHLRGVVLNSRDVTDRIRLEQELRIQGQRDQFGSQLTEALEMVDDETGAFDLIQRAIVEISPEAPTELLLADSSKAHLERVASSPTAGAPGCPVTSPFSCVAVRRGQPVTFEASDALNACPKLRGRPAGACAATCVPVSFMGRALGVLHSTGPDGHPPTPEQITQLTTLATQAGARIGTLRAFEKTQLQAATDGLTGLINRRTFEQHVRGMINQGNVFALAVADLDHFKAINDTHGHEAGDRALRLFAQVAKESLRDADVLARWGGEEFVFALAELDQDHAVTVLDRIRNQLAESFTGEHPRFTVSFGVTDSLSGYGLEQLMQIADAGLYTAKRNGRDRVTIGAADPDLPPQPRPQPDDSDRQAAAPGSHAPQLRPLLHEAADEPDPRPTGLEIR